MIAAEDEAGKVLDAREVKRSLQILAHGNLVDLRCGGCRKTTVWGLNNIAMVLETLLEEGSLDFNCSHCGRPLMMYNIGAGKRTVSLTLMPGVEIS